MSQKPQNQNNGILTCHCFPNKRPKTHRLNSKVVNLSSDKPKENRLSLTNNNDIKRKSTRTYHSKGTNTEPTTVENNGLPQKVIDLSTKCSFRVRHVIQLIQSNGIGKEDLLKNLGYAVELMDAIANEEQINVNDDDDINVNPDVVPLEVRDWIATTFSSAPNRSSRVEKPRFRAVANAIRAGIMVEKIFKKSNEVASMKIPNEISRFLKTEINEWSFDVFKLDDLSDGHALRYVALDLFLRHNFFHKYKINVQHFENLCQRIEEGYSKHHNPYHNLVHGADVAQTCHFIIQTYKLANWFKDIEIFALIFAALIHDYEHTGTTNNFHVNTGSDLTLLYNDRFVLESHHVSSIFRIMQDPNFNILKNLDKDDYKEFRSLAIEVILHTDMSTHFKQIKAMKSHLALGESLDKGMVLSMILHCADISHPAKDWKLHHRWTSQLLEEFFRQGDQEEQLKLPFSPLCDRKTILIPDSQIGFSNFIVEPSFTVLGNMLQFIYDKIQKHSLKHASHTAPNEDSKSISTSTILAQIPSVKSSIPHRWEAEILINRSIWQKKLEQHKIQEAINAGQESDINKK